MKKICLMLMIVLIAIILTNCSDSTSPNVKLIPPTQMAVIQVAISEFQLTWVDNSIKEDGYKIERKFDEGNWEEITQLSENSDEYLDDISLVRQTWFTVYYKIYSYEDNDVSEEVIIQTNISFPAPTQLTAIYSNNILIEWTDNSNGEEGFIVERKLENGDYAILSTVTENDTLYTDTDIEVDEVYYYRVCAYVGIFNSSFTNEIQISTYSNQLSADFEANITNGYAPLSINFTDNSTGDVISWDWDFGNGEVSDLQDPSIIYEEVGIYTVSLTVSDGTSQSTEIKVDFIEVVDFGGTFQDGFETYDDFVLEFNPWTLVDVDGSATYSIEDYTFPNQNYSGSYIIFNPSMVNPPLTDVVAHSGNKMAACFAATSLLNNDWMITPAITVASGDEVSFFAKSYTDQYGLERFNVAISTTGIAPADFTVISTAPYIEAPLEWTEYAYDLSSYAGQNIYVAIQCVTADAFIFFVDDFLIGPASETKAGNQKNDSIVNGTQKKVIK